MIVQVITEPVAGGAEALVRETHRRYLQKGVNSEVVFFSSGGRDLARGEYSLETGLRSPLAIMRLRRYLNTKKQENPDLVVHAHLTWPFLFVALASLFLNVPLVYTEHNTHNRRRVRWLQRLDRWFYSRYQRVLCISKGVHDALSEWVGPNISNRLVLAPNGATLYPLVERAPLKGRKIRAISVGSLHPKKNFETAIRAVADAKDLVARYVIVGEGAERSRLESLIAELDLTDVVHLAGWSDDVYGFYKEADVQLIPSAWEGFGLVAVEGMSTGLPVIGSDVPGLNEVLCGTESTILVGEPSSPKMWTKAIRDFSERLASMEVQTLASASRRQAERFSLEAMVERYLKVYDVLRMPHLLMVVNCPAFFLSHRLPVALAARENGYRVSIATGPGEKITEITAYGFDHYSLPITRSGQHVFEELRAWWSMVQLFRLIKPSIVHLVTIKPVLYGGLAARLTRVRGVVAAVSGLGTAFNLGGGIQAIRRFVIKRLYRSALKHKNIRVIFQNKDDRKTLVAAGAVKPGADVLIRGSGVDLTRYAYQPEPEGVPVVVMACRLLREKGVFQFVEAARILRQRGVSARFVLAGETDPGNPGTVDDMTLDLWREEGIVDVLGFCSDVAALYQNSHVVCLPSFYGEGIPKTLIEAAACGRAVVTTDWPGCRDAIIPGESGLLVPPKSVKELATAIEACVESPEKRNSMGLAGRCLAEKAFSLDSVIDHHMALYHGLISPSKL
ncbi:glycosyltransferase [Marinobacter hydrocarbonoclasticus]|uniref:glycosyltransferase n=1 Tax=Marinobacter nauticus TaxID=2743 RepID=UPI001C97165F|nr:glycosyltransferase [Marinobacter nauticus]MBY6192911.1 glycosyltransferase [Marinobacter nauticus]MBY6214059.1 glycosyltransferase [Marinobacter nauticus]